MLPHDPCEWLADLVKAFGAATANGQGNVLIEADRLIPDYIYVASGEITTDDLSRPKVDDVLDVLDDPP